MRDTRPRRASYEYDVFLSYAESAGMKNWVENHFYGALGECLEAEWPHKPQIYNYKVQPAGTKWPDKVKLAHMRSRFLVAIWAPPYFRSAWCMAEWTGLFNADQI